VLNGAVLYGFIGRAGGGTLKSLACDVSATGKTAVSRRESDPTKLAARDPQTGQFVEQSSFDDIEVATFSANVGVEAADLTGTTGFNGGDRNSFEQVEVVDYDDIVDRNEELVLLSARHRLSSYLNSTETADGTVSVAAEISASPSLTDVTNRAANPSSGNAFGPDNVMGRRESDDSIDVLGRPMVAVAHGPYTDGASGTGGGGSAGEDLVQLDGAPAEFGRFHPRDELFVNGRIVVWNVDDAGAHASISGQHVYGVLSD